MATALTEQSLQTRNDNYTKSEILEFIISDYIADDGINLLKISEVWLGKAPIEIVYACHSLCSKRSPG